LAIPLAGKTGTTNDEKDAWFVGFTPEVLTTVWVGYDQPRSMGVSSTGGRTALPIWAEYMKAATEHRDNPRFEAFGKIKYAMIDETTGRRVSTGGRRYPYIPGTEPEESGYDAGQASLQDLTTEL
jgi:penicillin-binding protein 1A